MTKRETDNLRELHTIALADETYQVWANRYREYAARFAEFADSQPEDVRNFLWGYAESGRLMNQRLAALACRHMDFPERK